MDPQGFDNTFDSASPGARSASLSPGSVLGQYRIVRLLGRGGMGEVYEAENTVNRKRYALKVLPRAATSSPSFVAASVGWRSVTALRPAVPSVSML